MCNVLKVINKFHYNYNYNDNSSFKAYLPSSSVKDLSVIHLNINSIGANGDIFLSFLLGLDYKSHNTYLSETWLNQRKKSL